MTSTTPQFGLVLAEGGTTAHLTDLYTGDTLCGTVFLGPVGMHGIVGPDAGSCTICKNLAAAVQPPNVTPAGETLDEAVHFGRGRYLAARVILTPGGQKVQLRASRADDPAASYAYALVLTDRLEWNKLCEASPRAWHATTPDAPKHDQAVLDGLAAVLDGLAVRALRILA